MRRSTGASAETVAATGGRGGGGIHGFGLRAGTGIITFDVSTQPRELGR